MNVAADDTLASLQSTLQNIFGLRSKLQRKLSGTTFVSKRAKFRIFIVFFKWHATKRTNERKFHQAGPARERERKRERYRYKWPLSSYKKSHFESIMLMFHLLNVYWHQQQQQQQHQQQLCVPTELLLRFCAGQQVLLLFFHAPININFHNLTRSFGK